MNNYLGVPRPNVIENLGSFPAGKKLIRQKFFRQERASLIHIQFPFAHPRGQELSRVPRSAPDRHI